jgi:hypothetical protein
VPCPHQFARDIRPLLHITADQKKCRLHTVLSKNFHQAKSVWVVRAIVISQRQLPGSGFQPGEGPPKPLPGRSHGLVSRSATGPNDTRSGKGHVKHEKIVIGNTC